MFREYVVDGNGAIVVERIKSPNYVPSVSGWSINEDGTVEFNFGTFRGTIIDTAAGTPAVLIYKGTPAADNLILALSAVSDVDQFGNSFSHGLTILAGNNGYLEDGVALHAGNTAVGHLDVNTSFGNNDILLDATAGNDLFVRALLGGILHMSGGGGMRFGSGMTGKYYFEHVTFPNKNVGSGAGYNTWPNFTQQELHSDYGPGQWSIILGAATWTCPETGLYAFDFMPAYTSFVSGSRFRERLAYTGARSYGPYNLGHIGQLDLVSNNAVDGSNMLAIPVMGLDAGDKIVPQFAQVTGLTQTTDTNSFCAIRRLL